jgi:thiol-disulfide isomerase/thioredoxin
MMDEPAIFFDTAPYCGACKTILPVVRQIAAKNGVDLYEMQPGEHDPETFVLPMIYIFAYDENGNYVKTALDGTATVGDIERALGNTSPNFLDNPFTNIGNKMEEYFSGIIEIGANGKPSAVSYEEEGNNRMTMIIVGILIVLVIAFMFVKYSK